MEPKRFTRAILLTVALIALRIMIILVLGNPFSSDEERWNRWIMAFDSTVYIEMAEDLADGEQDDASMVMPLYPLLLDATDRMISPPYLLTIIIQQLLIGISALVCYCIVKSIGGSERASVLALLIMLLVPTGIFWSTLILSDIPSAAVISITGLLWLLAVRKGSSFKSFILLMTVCGLYAGLGSMIRPIGVISLMVYILATALMVVFKRLRFLYALLGIACLVLFTLLPLGLWRMYNMDRFDLNALSTQQAYEPLKRLWMIDNDSYSDWVAYHQNLDSLAMHEDGTIDWSVRDSIYSFRTRQIFMNDPVRYVAPHLIRWPWLFSAGLRTNFLRPLFGNSSPPKFLYISVFAVNALIIAGFFYALLKHSTRNRYLDLIVLAGLWFLGTAISTGPIAYSRYSLTFLWSWIALAGISIDDVLSRFGRHQPQLVQGDLNEPGDTGQLSHGESGMIKGSKP